jgi:hypothetical protein
MPQEIDTRGVQDCTRRLEPCAPTRAIAASRLATAHAMLASEEGSTVNYKLNCPAWCGPYAEILLETDFERLLTILAAGTEAAVFQRHWESAADRAASRLFCARVAPMCSARSRSTQIGEHRVL